MARELARASRKVPGVRAVVARVRCHLCRARHQCAITILLDPPNERDDIEDGAEGSRSRFRDFAFARPRITFPNALGGRETFSPIRAMLLGPNQTAGRAGEGSQYPR